MKYIAPIIFIGLFTFGCISTDQSKSYESYWVATPLEKNKSLPVEFRGYTLDIAKLKEVLENEGKIVLPNPQGSFVTCELKDSGTMSKELAAKYPEIKSYTVIQNEGIISGRIDINPSGFYAMVTDNNSTYFINPIEKKSNLHISYDKGYAKKDSNNPFVDKVIK